MNFSIFSTTDGCLMICNSFKFFFPYLFILLLLTPLLNAETLFLRDNLRKANEGDYLVICFNKTDTLMHIYDKKDPILTVEEITIPESLRNKSRLNWRNWIQAGAPGHTSWVMYEINTSTGEMLRYYSFSKQGWFEISDSDNFLSKLLNLKLIPIPEKQRKRIGPKPSGPDFRSVWQPLMIIDGNTIKNVPFDAWRTMWPKDCSELSGKTIEIYLPQNSEKYPSYFPYWLQVDNAIGKTKIRIIDSGLNLKSPKPSLDRIIQNKIK